MWARIMESWRAIGNAPVWGAALARKVHYNFKPNDLNRCRRRWRLGRNNMTMSSIRRRLPIGLAAGFAVLLPTSLRADYLDDIGYTALVAELQAAGKAVPDGSGVSVTQTEASTGTSTSGGVTYDAYLPDSSLFTGVTITNASASAYPATFSGHANVVGQYLYGDASMARGISSVTAYLADDWIESGFLNATSGISHTAPKVESNDVFNASWVGSTGSAANDKIVLNRLDYAIQRDDFVAVVATNNGSTPENLPASAYNVISVGLTNGNHASGTSTVNTSVTFPQLVVPMGVTSYATPVVSSAAALLIQTARASATTSTNGSKSEAIKAILLAGATKDEFASWSRTDTAPLDATFGAGELNVQNSYHILTAGEQTANSTVAATGWDFGSISRTATTTYSFDLASSGDVSIVLTWNAIYTGGNYNSLTLGLANLDLYLYAVDAGGGQTLVQQSVSTGNIEEIWATNLNAGDYIMKVTYGSNSFGSLSSIEYALAWQTTALDVTAVPESSWTAGGIAVALVIVISARRRRLVQAVRPAAAR